MNFALTSFVQTGHIKGATPQGSLRPPIEQTQGTGTS